MKPKIYFKKVRDFGEVFGASFGYLTRNFRSFFGAILALAGPFFLLNSIASSFLLKFSFGNLAYGGNPMQMLSDMAVPFFFVIIFSILGSSVYNTVVNEHLLVNEELSENEKPSIGMIAKRFFGSYWRNLGVMFLLMLFSIITYVVFALIIGVFIVLLKSIGFVGVLLMVLMFMFLIMVLMPIYVYMLVAIVFTSQRHKLGFFAATGQVLKYLKGNFWMTWLISFVGGLCTYIMIIIAYLPVYILMVVSMMSRIKMDDINSINNIQNDVPIYVTVITSVVGILIICISSLYVVMMNYQCTSNEEKIEGTSILQKIESI
jgi:hypothetical protein